MSDRSDAEFVEAACQGDIESFGRLYDRHYRMVVGLAYSRLSDRHLAEDAAQEAFAVACGKLATLAKPEQFAAWMAGICRRVADRMRLKRLTTSEKVTDQTASSEEPPESSMKVRRAVGQLPLHVREVVVLHYFSGLSHEHIGKVLNISAAAVHGRLQRARSRLAELLEPSRERIKR